MQQTLPPWAEQLAVFDTETTGVNTKQARIVTASIAVINGIGEATERYDWMLDPGVPIPPQATEVHGISTELAQEKGMRADTGVKQIIERLESMIARGIPVVVFNAPYDLSLLYHEAIRHSLSLTDEISPILDPLVIDRQMDRFRKGKRTLEAACTHYGVQLAQAHDAGADAIAAGHVMQRIAGAFRSQLPDDIEELHRLQIEWASTQAASFERFMRDKRDPSFTADRRWPLQQ